jgi:hypothetical protein
MAAAQAKPAIAAEPAPAGGAPRNGTSQVAPTTVQPAAQVAAGAPTQVQAQRSAPANGGAPVGAQANGKQGVNGKEEEEDWWTE